MFGSVNIGRRSVAVASQPACETSPAGGGPPRLGLVFWVKGDAGLTRVLDPDAGFLVTAWADQSGMGQDLSSPAGFQPLAGVDTIDAIPCVTYQQTSATDEQYMTRAGFSMLNRSSVPFSFAQPRTVMAMVLPRFTAAAFNITGGPVFCFGELPAFQCIFDLEDTDVPNALYAWSSGWRDLTPAAKGPNTTGGAGGIYNGVPTLVEWHSTGNPNLTFAINGAAAALSHQQYGATGATPNQGFFLGTPQAGVGLHFLGAFAEVTVWDYDLTTDAAALAAARTYYRTRYPSAPIA